MGSNTPPVPEVGDKVSYGYKPAGSGEQPTKPTKDDKPDYPAKPGKGDKADKDDKGHKDEKPTKDEKPDYPAKPEKGDKADKDDKGHKDEKPTKDDKPDYPAKPEKDDKDEYPAKPEQPAKDDKGEKDLHGGKDQHDGHPVKVVHDKPGDQYYFADSKDEKFVFSGKSGGDDTIKGFDDKHDTIKIENDYKFEIDNNGKYDGDVVITWGKDNMITLKGVEQIDESVVKEFDQHQSDYLWA